jgi:hypothetical protein
MKIADPRPGTVGAALYSITAKCAYAAVCSHNASLPPRNGGDVPQRTCRKRLYVAEAGSSSHQSPHASTW